MSRAGPSVTVAVCTRNRPDSLRRLLESLARLDPAPDEILVADQSDPAERERARAFLGPPIRHLPVEPRGLGYNREQALRAARSEIVAFTDDDCRVGRGWVGAIREAFSAHPDASALAGSLKPDPDDPLPAGLPAWVTEWGGASPRLFRGEVDPAEIGGGLNMAFRSDALRSIGGFDPLLGAGGPLHSAEDTDAFHRILRSGRSIVYAPEAVVSHHPPRGLEEHERNERLYALGRGAWAAKGWVEGDRFPGLCWRRTFFRNVFYLLTRWPWEGPRRMRQRAAIAANLVFGWAQGRRAYGSQLRERARQPARERRRPGEQP